MLSRPCSETGGRESDSPQKWRLSAVGHELGRGWLERFNSILLVGLPAFSIRFNVIMNQFRAMGEYRNITKPLQVHIDVISMVIIYWVLVREVIWFFYPKI